MNDEDLGYFCEGKVSRLYRAVGPGFNVLGVYSEGVKMISCLLTYKH